MSDRYEAARPAVEAWLGTPGTEYTQECDHPDYILWLWRVTAKGLYGTAELIDTPDLSDGGPVLALTLGLDLPPLKTLKDAYALLELNEVLTGCSIFARDSADGTPFALIAKRPVRDVREVADVEDIFRCLERTKRFIEDEE